MCRMNAKDAVKDFHRSRGLSPRRFNKMAKLRFWLLLAVIGYGVYLAALFCAQRTMLYPGVLIKVPPQPPSAPGLEQVLLKTSYGKVEALFLPSLTASNTVRSPALVYAHGNGEVVDYWVSALDGFRERGFSVLLVEYPGYGRCEGTPSARSDLRGDDCRIRLAGC